eukprot:GHRQ01012248.1.p4 GENE.GHRQ01012248.1~~GHRQ01012248.1.p4  ORF type:complete len:105 (-),score=12.08 GHRQ01012248.1:575-889(-)
MTHGSNAQTACCLHATVDKSQQHCALLWCTSQNFAAAAATLAALATLSRHAGLLKQTADCSVPPDCLNWPSAICRWSNARTVVQQLHKLAAMECIGNTVCSRYT